MPSLASSSFGDQVADALFKAKHEAASKGANLWRSDIVRIVNALDASRSMASPLCGGSPENAKSPPTLTEYTPEALEALRLRICGWAQFKRRPGTKWTEKELKALKKVFPFDPADVAILEAWYNGDDRTYCRKDIQTLLNNWTGEIDRARNHVKPDENSKPADYSRI